MIFHVLVVVPITLAKQKEKTVEHVWTFKNSAVYKHLGDCTGVQHLLDITPLYSSLFTSSAPTQIRN